MATRTGACLCGAVRYELKADPMPVTYCHCSRCRRWHGHFGAYSAVSRADFVMLEERGLAWYQSSPKARRGFCRECGSSLFWDEVGDPNYCFCPGTVDDPAGMKGKAHIYIDSQGAYYDLPNDGLERRPEPKK